MKASEFTVPLAALALPGETEGQSTPPAEGDVVDFSGTAKVLRIDGEQAVLAPETINGEPVASAGAPEDLDADEAELGAQARKDQSADREIY
jgi:hypothetical protein